VRGSLPYAEGLYVADAVIEAGRTDDGCEVVKGHRH
jgi:hypothetical protein